MELTAKKAAFPSAAYRDCKGLLMQAFPREERYPMWLLSLLTVRKWVDFRAFYDKDAFCGLLYTAQTQRMIFVLYLAVNDQIHSKGYGSAILSWLRENTPQKEIVLHIEPVDEEAEDLPQRLRRLDFYKRNGFHETGAFLRDRKERYALLSTTPHFSRTEYLRLMKRFSFGSFQAELGGSQ